MEKSSTTIIKVFFALLFGGFVAYLFVVANTTSSSNNQPPQTTPTASVSSSQSNLELQNECITNAQQVDMSSILFYKSGTDLLPGEQAGWTTAGQIDLQSKTQDCQTKYPTN